MQLHFDPPAALPAAARLELLHPRRGADPEAWLAERLGPPRPSLRLASARHDATRTGWPLELRIYEADGSLAVVALYEFFDLTAAVFLAGLGEDWVRGEEAALLCALRGAEPDWQGDEPLLIADLWAAPGRRDPDER